MSNPFITTLPTTYAYAKQLFPAIWQDLESLVGIGRRFPAVLKVLVFTKQPATSNVHQNLSLPARTSIITKWCHQSAT